MRSVIKYFIQHPTVVNLCLILLIGLGSLQLMQTQTTNFPKRKIRFLSVVVPYPGASPSEVEKGISIKIEENLEGIQGIDRVSSTSGENRSTILIELEENSNPNDVLAEVKNAVDKISNLPDRAESPIFDKVEIKDISLAFGITGAIPLSIKKDYAQQIKNDLLATPEISDVIIYGLPAEEIEIRIRENDLQTYQLTFQEVAQAVRLANLETFGGEIKTVDQNITIKADSKGYYAKELQNITIKSGRQGNRIRLKDVADVIDQFADSPNGRYLDDQAIVSIQVNAIKKEDLIRNAEVTRAYIEEFNRTHSNVSLTILEDGTTNVRDRIRAMAENGIIGVILVMIVLALFLDKYLAFWVAIKIPIAVVGMFLLSPIQGMTINVVSLFGFILVLGILVDDGVVIGENIYRWAKEKNAPPLKAALEGTMEMLVPVMISLTTTAVAFSMFFFLPTQAGEFFGEMGFVVVAVLIIAMIESFFFLPAHLAHVRALRADYQPSRFEKWFDHALKFIRDRLYLPIYRPIIKKGRWLAWLTVLFFVICFVGSISLMRSGQVGFTFFPNIDDDAIFIEMSLAPGTPVELTQKRLSEIETAVWETNKEFSEGREDEQQVVRFVEQITGPKPNEGKLKVTFLGGEQRGISSFELSNRMRELSPPILEAEGLTYGVGATQAVFGKPISFALFSRDLDDLRQAKNELKAQMQSRDDIKDISDSDQLGVQEMILRTKPEAELLGLSLGQIMANVRAAFFGEEVQSLQRGEDEVKIWVRYPKEGRTKKEQLMNMRINVPNGNTYLLSDLVDVEERIGSLAINHLEGQREIRVEANVANLNISAPQVISAIEQEYLTAIVDKYPSVTYSLEGQNRMSFKMVGAISIVGPVILLFIFGLIVLNFNSFSQAFIVFLLFPFALIGVILGHWAQGLSLNIFSFVGTIALLGVFVNDSLVFISTLNNKLKEGEDWGEALMDTAKIRFRPILLTTVTTVAGLAPLIFSTSLGAQFLKGPAISMAYGLSFGLFNILLLLPALLHTFNGLRVRVFNLFHRERATSEQVEPAIKALRHIIPD